MIKFNKELLRKAVDHIPVCELPYSEWISFNKALYNCGFTKEEAKKINSNDDRYEERGIDVRWNGFGKRNNTTPRTLFYLAWRFGNWEMPETKDAGYSWIPKYEKSFAKDYGQGVRVKEVYDYYDEHEVYQYSKIRLEGGRIEKKLIRHAYIDYENDQLINDHQIKHHFLYNLQSLIMAREKKYPIIIVEGEKDVQTLEKLLRGKRYAVTTAGSATDWNSEYASYFRGANVILLPDNDETGRELARRIRRDLRTWAYSIREVTFSRLEHGDVTDYLQKEGGTLESVIAEIKNAEKAYAPWVIYNSKDQKITYNEGLLAECFRKNEHYRIIQNDNDKAVMYLYQNGVYKRANKNAVKDLIREYLETSRTRDSMLNGVFNQIIADGKDHAVEGQQADDSKHLNFKNGLLDLEHDELIPHTPKVFTKYQFDFDYVQKIPLDTDYPKFTRFFSDFCRDRDGKIDKEKAKVIQEVVGNVMCNPRAYKIKKIVCFVSKIGDTGKSTLIAIIRGMFGDVYVVSQPMCKIQVGERFSLGDLSEIKVILCGDNQKAEIRDSTMLKSLSGGDGVTTEQKFVQGKNTLYHGSIVSASNFIPQFTDDQGLHMQERLLIIPCDHHIADADRDVNMLSEMIKNEMPAIFRFFYEGYKRLKANNFVFSECKRIDEFKNTEYRKEIDALFRYVSENYEITKDPAHYISRTVFDSGYNMWLLNSDTRETFSKSGTKERLMQMGVACDDHKNLGTTTGQAYIGIRALK